MANVCFKKELKKQTFEKKAVRQFKQRANYMIFNFSVLFKGQLSYSFSNPILL